MTSPSGINNQSHLYHLSPLTWLEFQQIVLTMSICLNLLLLLCDWLIRYLHWWTDDTDICSSSMHINLSLLLLFLNRSLWHLKTSQIWRERKLLDSFPTPSRSTRVQTRYQTAIIQSWFNIWKTHICLYSVSLFVFSLAVLLHFLLSKREKLPGIVSHVAKHGAG